MSQLCERCVAVAKSTRLQCRNFSQCRTNVKGKRVPLCYVHAEQIRRNGASQFYFAHYDQLKSVNESIQTVDERLKRIEKALFMRESVPTAAAAATVESPATVDSPVTSIAPNNFIEAVRPLHTGLENNTDAFMAFFDQLQQFARTVIAEIQTTKRMIEKLCINMTMSDEGILRGSVKNYYEFSEKTDQFIDQCIEDATKLAQDFLENHVRKFDKLQKAYDKAKQELIAELDKNCKQKNTSWSISLKLALDWASGKIECQGESMPTEMRTWYTSAAEDETGQYIWTDKQVLCNIGKQAANALQMNAFASKQELRNDFRVHDTLDNFVTIGKLKPKKQKGKEDRQRDSERLKQSLADRQKLGVQAMQKYLKWLETLERLVELAALLGIDPSKLLFEKQQTNLSLATLAVSLGKEVALQYMSAEKFASLSTLASLSTTYQSYMSTNIGVAGMANLAAYNAHLHFKDKVPKSQLARLVRYAYSNAFIALMGVGGAGALASLLWFNTTAWPTRVTPTAGPAVNDVPVLKTGAEVFYALRDIGSQTLLLTRPELAALQAHPESARFLSESVEQTARTLLRNAEAVKRATTALMKAPEARLAVYYGSLYTRAYDNAAKTRQQYALAQQTPLSLWIDPANSELSRSMQRYHSKLLERMLEGRNNATISNTEMRRLEDQATAIGLQIDSSSRPAVAQQLLSSASNVPASADFDIYSSAQTAGLSAAAVLGLLIRARANPQTAAVVRDSMQDMYVLNREASAFADQIQSPLYNNDYFRNDTYYLQRSTNGMQQLKRADLELLKPDEQMRRDQPEVSVAMLAAIEAAQEQIDERDTLFDDNVINFGDIEQRAAQGNVWPLAFSDEMFLLQLSGASVGGLSGTDVANLQNYFLSLETNSTAAGAFDAQMQRIFAEFDQVAGSTARAMATDASALVASISDLDSNMVARAQKALKKREVRNLFLASRENYQGFIRGIAESATSSQVITQFDQNVSLHAALQLQLGAFVDLPTAISLSENIIAANGDADRIKALIESKGVASGAASEITKNFIDSMQPIRSIISMIPYASEKIALELMEDARGASETLKEVMVRTAPIADAIGTLSLDIATKIVYAAFDLSEVSYNLAKSGAMSSMELIKKIPADRFIAAIDSILADVKRELPEQSASALKAAKVVAQNSLVSAERQLASAVKAWTSDINKQIPPIYLNETEVARVQEGFLEQVSRASRTHANLSFDATNPIFIDRATGYAFPVTGKTLYSALADAQREYIAKTVQIADKAYVNETLVSEKETLGSSAGDFLRLQTDWIGRLRPLQSRATRQLAIWSVQEQQSLVDSNNAPISSLFQDYLDANVATKKVSYDAPRSIENEKQTAANISLWYNNEFERLGRGALPGAELSAENVAQIEQSLARNQQIEHALEDEQKLTLLEIEKVNQCLAGGFSVLQCSILLGLPEKSVNDVWVISASPLNKAKSTTSSMALGSIGSETIETKITKYVNTAACLLNEPTSSGLMWLFFNGPGLLRRVKRQEWTADQVSACTMKLDLPSNFAGQFLDYASKKPSAEASNYLGFLGGFLPGVLNNIGLPSVTTSATTSTGPIIPIGSLAP